MTINERVSNLTLDAAIDHATERADALSGPCAAQHAQLAAWLRELQQYRAAEPVAVVLSSRAGNDTSTIDKALPEGQKLYAVPQLPQPVEPEITSEELDDELLEQLIDFRRSMLNHHRKEGNKVQTVMHGMVLRVMLELQERRAATLTAAPAVQAEHSGTTHAPEPVQSGGKVQEVQEPVSQPRIPNNQ